MFPTPAAPTVPDAVAPPSIDTLAAEVVRLEDRERLGETCTVSLGDSVARLLRPKGAAGFGRRRATWPTRTFRLQNVMLDASMMALFSGRQPIPETLYMISPEARAYALVKPLYPTPTDPDRHYVVGCNIAFRNYYHWMVQALPAIDWGVRNHRNPHVVLALPPLQPWQEETLRLLGHADVPRLDLEPTAHYDLASAEYSEFLGSRMIEIVSRAAASTYARLRQAVPPAPDGGDAIYVARTDATRRVALNEAALIAMLERQGVKIVVPGALPVQRQIALFRRATLVIGAHGAGLSNIMGCEPGSHLYELLPRHYPNICINRLAQACGLHYWGDVFPSSPGEAGPHERSWRINLQVVAARLEAIRSHIAAAGDRTGACATAPRPRYPGLS